MQLFNGWVRYALRQTSKLFDIELWVDGFDGTKNTKTHECYFNGPINRTQVGRRWNVSATLLAIEEQTVTELEWDQLAILDAGFPDGILDTMDALEELVEINIGGCLAVP